MSFTQGLSGLNASSKNLEVIGNNVANANTVGFKQSQAQFGDVFAAALSGAGSSQIGIGVKMETVAQQFVQGNISTTNNSLDMAINGPGFFILKDGQGTTGYSRNGQFQLDKNGFIVSSAGNKLQGYAIDPTTGAPIGSPTDLSIPTAVADAAATGASLGVGTKGIVAGLNLDSRALPPANTAFSPTDPTTYNKSTSTTTYDSKGVAQTTAMFFVKQSVAIATNASIQLSTPQNSLTTTVTVTPPAGGVYTAPTVGQPIVGAGFPVGASVLALGPAGSNSFTVTSPTPPANTTAAPITATLLGDVANQWNVYTTVTDPNGVSLYPLPTPASGGYLSNGTLSFAANGRYTSFVPNTNAPTAAANTAAGVFGPNNGTTSVSFSPAGANPETIPFDFASSTQFGAAFGITKLTQDGFTSGQLSGFSISADGTVLGRYSNGVAKPLGQVALATFPNMQGLQPMGNNEWLQSSASGAPVVNAPGTGNNGVLQTSSTEDSNVDLTAELVNMITAQRVYQANAQTIKTQDQVMQTLVNLR